MFITKHDKIKSFYIPIKENNEWFLQSLNCLNKQNAEEKVKKNEEAFRDWIRHYRKRKYKIPNFSLEHNLFNQDPLWLNDREWYEYFFPKNTLDSTGEPGKKQINFLIKWNQYVRLRIENHSKGQNSSVKNIFGSNYKEQYFYIDKKRQNQWGNKKLNDIRIALSKKIDIRKEIQQALDEENKELRRYNTEMRINIKKLEKDFRDKEAYKKEPMLTPKGEQAMKQRISNCKLTFNKKGAKLTTTTTTTRVHTSSYVPLGNQIGNSRNWRSQQNEESATTSCNILYSHDKSQKTESSYASSSWFSGGRKQTKWMKNVSKIKKAALMKRWTMQTSEDWSTACGPNFIRLNATYNSMINKNCDWKTFWPEDERTKKLGELFGDALSLSQKEEESNKTFVQKYENYFKKYKNLSKQQLNIMKTENFQSRDFMRYSLKLKSKINETNLNDRMKYIFLSNGLWETKKRLLTSQKAADNIINKFDYDYVNALNGFPRKIRSFECWKDDV